MTKIFSVLYLRLILVKSGSAGDEFQQIYPTGTSKASDVTVDLVIAMLVAMNYAEKPAIIILSLSIVTIQRQIKRKLYGACCGQLAASAS